LHSTGIYTWDFLYNLGVNMDQRMNNYLEELKRVGLSREPISRVKRSLAQEKDSPEKG
jgi:DUF971 family protein